MRKIFPASLNKLRVKTGPMKSPDSFGFTGAFVIPSCFKGEVLGVVSSDGSDWLELKLPLPIFEHVSVSVRRFERLPTWEEMDLVKNIFWDKDEVVVQFHVNNRNKVDNKPVLHLWKMKNSEYVLPPSICLGFTDEQLQKKIIIS